jgi:hypothetical protein
MTEIQRDIFDQSRSRRGIPLESHGLHDLSFVVFIIEVHDLIFAVTKGGQSPLAGKGIEGRCHAIDFATAFCALRGWKPRHDLSLSLRKFFLISISGVIHTYTCDVAISRKTVSLRQRRKSPITSNRIYLQGSPLAYARIDAPMVKSDCRAPRTVASALTTSGPYLLCCIATTLQMLSNQCPDVKPDAEAQSGPSVALATGQQPLSRREVFVTRAAGLESQRRASCHWFRSCASHLFRSLPSINRHPIAQNGMSERADGGGARARDARTPARQGMMSTAPS